MTVFIVQRPVPNGRNWEPDLTPATEFGKLDYIFEGGEPVYALPGPMMKKAQEKLKDFDPEKDYILWANNGDPAAVWITCFSLSILGFEKVSFLYWNRKRVGGIRDHQNGFYTPITYNLQRHI